MRTLQGWLLPVFMLPMAVYAQEATVKEVHDAPAVRGSIIANMLQEHDNPFTLYPYDTNYIIYTQTSDLNKEAIASYDWAENARKDEVKFQLSFGVSAVAWDFGAKLCTGRLLHTEILVAAF